MSPSGLGRPIWSVLARRCFPATGARFGFRAALPFVGGVILGKQLIIWPIGFGLMELAAQAPLVFATLKWLSAAYICWLAWKVAHLRLDGSGEIETPPGFLAGEVCGGIHGTVAALFGCFL